MYVNIGDCEITGREIIASITIICLSLVLGFHISGKINQKILEQNLRYEQAVQITDPSVFGHSLDTSIGDAFAEGTIVADNPVSVERIDGQYMMIEEEEQHYKRHTRQVSHKDSKGKTYYTTETYYSWDTEDTNYYHTDTVTFLGRSFDYDLFAKKCIRHYYDTVKVSRRVRYEYSVVPIEVNATLFGTLKDGTFNGNVEVYRDATIEEALEKAKSSSSAGLIFFWIFWILLTGGAVFLFYYAENEWLNDD